MANFCNPFAGFDRAGLSPLPFDPSSIFLARFTLSSVAGFDWAGLSLLPFDPSSPFLARLTLSYPLRLQTAASFPFFLEHLRQNQFQILLFFVQCEHLILMRPRSEHTMNCETSATLRQCGQRPGCFDGQGFCFLIGKLDVNVFVSERLLMSMSFPLTAAFRHL